MFPEATAATILEKLPALFKLIEPESRQFWITAHLVIDQVAAAKYVKEIAPRAFSVYCPVGTLVIRINRTIQEAQQIYGTFNYVLSLATDVIDVARADEKIAETIVRTVYRAVFTEALKRKEKSMLEKFQGQFDAEHKEAAFAELKIKAEDLEKTIMALPAGAYRDELAVPAFHEAMNYAAQAIKSMADPSAPKAPEPTPAAAKAEEEPIDELDLNTGEKDEESEVKK